MELVYYGVDSEAVYSFINGAVVLSSALLQSGMSLSQT